MSEKCQEQKSSPIFDYLVGCAQATIGRPPGGEYVASAVAADFISLAAASVGYFLVERPTQRLGRMLVTSIRSRRSVIA
jgi:peptidoglycan/LPS O-acetylase OafA/YrhL